MNIHLPHFTPQELVTQAVLSYNTFSSNILDINNSPWCEVYPRVHSFLRHSFTTYDHSVKADPSRREELQQIVGEAIHRRYPWLRADTDPRQVKSIVIPDRKPLDQASAERVKMIEDRARLLHSKRQAQIKGDKEFARVIQEKIRKIDAELETSSGLFRTRDGGLIYNHHDSGCYSYAGYSLPDNKTWTTMRRCNSCGQYIRRSRKEVDHGAGVWLIAFACHCTAVGAQQADVWKVPYYWDQFSAFKGEAKPQIC
jgi:hypothetical protein